MIYYPISALINAIASALVFIVVFIKNPRSDVNRAFCYFAFSVAFWSYCYFLWQISKNPDSALFWCRMLMAGAIFIPSTFLHFSVNLTGQSKEHSKRVLFWYIASIFFLIIDFTSFFIKDIRPRLYFQHWPSPGIAYTPFLAMFAFLTIYAHVLMYRSFQNISEAKRNQIKYVFLGTAIGFLGGSTNYLLWYDIPIPPIGNALVAIYVILVAYSIVKHRLMDIQLVIARSFILCCVYAAVLAVVAVLAYPMRPMLQALLGAKWYLAPVCVFVALSAAAPFAYLYYQQKHDQRRLGHQRAQLARLKQIISTAIEFNHEQLLKNIPAFLVQMYREDFDTEVEYAAIYLHDEKSGIYNLFSLKAKKGRPAVNAQMFKKDPIPDWFTEKGPDLARQGLLDEKYLKAVRYEDIEYYQSYQANPGLIRILEGLKASLRSFKADVCVSCFFNDSLLAFLLLGKKQKGSYTQEELDTFSLLAHDVAAAIKSGELRDDLEQNYVEAIHAIITALEERDSYTKGHSERVVKYSLLMAEELKDTFPYTRIFNFTDKVRRAALLHDVGKIGVPDSILLKSGKLTDEEFQTLKQHPQISLTILDSIRSLSEEIRDGIVSHHEKFDGTGYLKGSQGHRIPPIARIIAVADAYDAMTSSRPYRKAMSEEAAIQEINRCSGRQFDPNVVEAFNKVYAIENRHGDVAPPSNPFSFNGLQQRQNEI
jgi:HD-GYP domain-containing protein (c-di-GMP phosphodiesterase class II)